MSRSSLPSTTSRAYVRAAHPEGLPATHRGGITCCTVGSDVAGSAITGHLCDGNVDEMTDVKVVRFIEGSFLSVFER